MRFSVECTFSDSKCLSGNTDTSAIQNTQFQLADMATKVEAAKMMVYKAAMAKATQKVYSVEAAQAKLYAAEVAMEVTTKAVQLHGGYGYIREYDVERMMRDAKITEIYEGTSEVQRMVTSAPYWSFNLSAASRPALSSGFIIASIAALLSVPSGLN